jgi:hypothetical protein
MPPRHRFLEPIHNVKEGFRPHRRRSANLVSSSLENFGGRYTASAAAAGGASRDRTDDLKLAKLALSQLSYGPKAMRNRGRAPRTAHKWWAEKELNLRPHAYQACALTT